MLTEKPDSNLPQGVDPGRDIDNTESRNSPSDRDSGGHGWRNAPDQKNEQQ